MHLLLDFCLTDAGRGQRSLNMEMLRKRRGEPVFHVSNANTQPPKHNKEVSNRLHDKVKTNPPKAQIIFNTGSN